MSITADLIRGHTEAIILAALLQGDSYGYRINRAMCDLTDGRYEFKEATLYTVFRRLEESGYIRSYWGNESTGARRRYYAITPEGRAAYRSMMREWQEASALLERLMCFGASDGGTDDTERL